MANSQEESVNLDVYQLFVRFALTLHQMSTFYAVLSKQSEGVMLKEDFDVLCLADTLLHDLRGTEERLADDEIDFLGQSCKIQGVLTGRVATADNGHRLLAVEETIAGGTG